MRGVLCPLPEALMLEHLLNSVHFITHSIVLLLFSWIIRPCALTLS